MKLSPRITGPTALVLLASALLLGGAARLPAQEKREITPEWIHSRERAAIGALPDTRWLPDGRLLLVGGREGSGRLRVYDPEADEVEEILDSRKVLLRLSAALGRNLSRLPAPSEISEDGKRALHVIAGDLFVVDIAAGQVRRLTQTPEREFAARFSPDGGKVAFIRENDLYVADLKSGRTTRLTRDGSETILNGTLSWVYWEEIFGRRDIGYWWSPDSRRIAFLRTDESLVTEMTYVDWRPVVPRVIRQRYPKSGTANPVVHVGVVRADGKGDVVWPVMDGNRYEYLCRVKWLPDGVHLAVQTMDRSQKELDLYFVNGFDGKARHILKERDPAWVNINDDLYFLKDGKHFLWVSERSGYAHLYRYTLDGKLVNAVTSGEWALRASNPVFWLRKAVLAIDEQAGIVYVSGLKDSTIANNIYRVGLDGKNMQRITRRDGTWRPVFSDDARFFASSFSSVTKPPSLAVYKTDGTVVRELAAPRTDLVEGLALSLPELFEIPAADGFPMPAMVYKPSDFDASKRYPVIVHLYAGPSAPMVQNQWQGWMYFNSILTRRGYVVVTFDNRSATGISKLLENTILGQMSGDHELEDIVAGVRWLKQQRWVDPERVGIWGWSNGGMVTLLGMTRSKEFKAGISVAPVTNWRYYDTKWGETVNKRPQDNPKGYEITNLVKRAKDLHGRLLLVHGTYDDNVHIQNSYNFMDQLIAHGLTFELMIYPMRQHGLADLAARVHLYKTMLSFWSRNL